MAICFDKILASSPCTFILFALWNISIVSLKILLAAFNSSAEFS